MDFPSFALSASKQVFDLVGAVAWPVVVLILAVQFKRPIGDLLQKLTSLSAGGVTATFDQKLGKIERQVAAEAMQQGHPPRPPADLNDQDRYLRLVELSPAAAVVTKWVDVEQALRDLATQRDVSLRPNEPPMRVIDALRRREIIGPRPARILNELRELRNLAAHPNHRSYREISREEALRFAKLADETIQLLGRK